MKLFKTALLPVVMIVMAISGNTYSKQTQMNTHNNEATTQNAEASTQTPADDKKITASIQSQIKGSSMLSKLPVQVKTSQGIVSLSGNVNSDTEASSLVEIAQSIVGVREVDGSNLKIKESQQPFEDMLTTAKIKGLLIREDIFGTKDIASINISVETNNGVVYLSGTVDNKQQIDNAIKLIQGVAGVKKVEFNVKKVTPTNNTNGNHTTDTNGTNNTKNNSSSY